MGKNISVFEKRYEVNNFNIIVKGEMKRREYGEYYAEIEYVLPQKTATRKMRLSLNGPGKNKLEKKIINYLSAQIKR